jgi:hypothetical protein
LQSSQHSTELPVASTQYPVSFPFPPSIQAHSHLATSKHNSPDPYPQNAQGGKGSWRQTGLKHNDPRLAAAPAVPSFLSALPQPPSNPNSLHAEERRKKKKKRKYNQLGLTPRTEEHENSEEEDDTGEEARLAAEAGANTSGL